jgi:hypothetical protein
MPVTCKECGVSNPESGRYCTKCGAGLEVKRTKADKASDRFQTVVAFLIAAVSITGAILAFRITVAAGDAADADVAGIVSSVNRHQAQVASQADLYRDLRAYLEVRIHDLLSDAFIAERDRHPDLDPIQDDLWDAGWTETYVAESYLDQIPLNPEYLRSDGSYDVQAYLDIQGADWALEADLNQAGHFQEADRLRSKVQWLMACALVLTLTLFFYTLAEVISHGVKYVLVVVGTCLFSIGILSALIIELVVA